MTADSAALRICYSKNKKAMREEIIAEYAEYADSLGVDFLQAQLAVVKFMREVDSIVAMIS